MAFNHIALYVFDLQKSSDFYEHILQLQKIEEPFKQGKHVWFKMGEHNQLHLVAKKKSAQKNDSKEWHFGFSVPDLDAFIQRLEKEKISYGNFHDNADKISVRPDGVRQVYFQDPDGYWLEANDDKY